MNRKLFWCFFILIALLATFFRFFKLGGVPVSLYWDEVAILADARIVAATGHDMHGNIWFQALFPSYGDYKLPVYIWLATVSVKLFSATEFAVRLPSALAGLLTMLVGFFIVKELNRSSQKFISTQKVQLAVFLTIATSFWSIMFSRTAFEGHLAQSLVGLSILCIFLSKKKSWLLLISAVIGALAVYTYYSVRFVWPVIFILATLLVFFEEHQFTKSLRQLFQKEKMKYLIFSCISVGLFFLLLVPMSQSPYYNASQQFRLSANSVLQQDAPVHEANYYTLLSGNIFIDRIFFHRDLLTLKLLASNYSKNLSFEFLFLTGDPNLRHGTGQFGLFALILVAPFIIGLFLLARHNKKVLLLLLCWWAISLLPASVPLETPHALRSLNALLPISIIIGYGMTYFLILNSLKRKIISITFFLIFSAQVFSFWHYYLSQYPRESASAWQDGYKKLAGKILSERASYADVRISYSDQRLYLWFLAYPFYSPQEIQSWKKKDFQLDKIDGISFQKIDIDMLRTITAPLIVVTQPGELENSNILHQTKPIRTELLFNSFGKPIFELAYFNEPPKN